MRAALLAVLVACGRFHFEPAAGDGTMVGDGQRSQGIVSNTGVPPFSTGGGTWVDVPGATITFTPGSPQQHWLLLVSAGLSSTSTSQVSVEARYVVNDVEHGVGGIDNETAGHGASWTSFYVVTGTTTPQTVQVQLRDLSGTGTIDDIELIAFALPAAGDVHYAETEPSHVAGLAWTSVQTLTFTPASPGLYLVLAQATNGSADTTGVRLLDPNGGIWPDPFAASPTTAYLGSPRTCRLAYFLVRTLNLSPGAQSFQLQGLTSIATGDLSYTRLLAVQAYAFASFQTGVDLPIITTNSTSPVARATLTVPAFASDRIALQNMVVASEFDPVHDRVAAFTDGTGKIVSYSHSMDDHNYRASFGRFSIVPPAGGMLTNSFATSASSMPAESKESVIDVLAP